MKKKIVIVCPSSPMKGGPGLFVKNWMEYCKNLNWNLMLIHHNTARPPKKATVAKEGVLNAGIKNLFRSAYIMLVQMFKFIILLNDEKPHGVHIKIGTSYVFWEGAVYLLISKIFCRNIIIHEYSHFDLYYKNSSSLIKTLIKIVFKLSPYSIILARSHLEILESFLKKDKCFLIPSHIDLKKIYSVHIYSTEKNSKTPFKLLIIAGMQPYRKGIKEIIMALRIAKKSNISNIHVNVIGGFYNEPVIKMIKNNQVEDMISLLGFVDDKLKYSYFASSDGYLLPSYFEGFPHTILEAMAFGLPVIASNIGGILDVVVDGQNGFLINRFRCLYLIRTINITYKLIYPNI